VTGDLPDYRCLIIGAGFSGIGAAIKLDQAGFGDYLVVEAGDGVGGTWHWNTYPGIAVDIPSFSYQFSFEQRPDWSRTYAPGKELKAYAEHCADKYGIRPKIRFNTKVLAVEFDDERALWRVQTDPGGEVTARFLVNASGVLTVPRLPDIDGVDSFDGTIIHTARWDHNQDLTGKRVAVIGTGASAVQLIPEIAPIVKELKVFQRTPIWCFPKFDVPLTKLAHRTMRAPGGRTIRAIQRLISQAYVEVTFPLPAHYFTIYPLARWMESVGRAYLRLQVRDPLVREQLTPQYAIGCKRPGFHNSYLSTFNRDNVRLVTEPIDKVTASAVATTDGASHEIDALVLATGFHVLDSESMPTFAVSGSGGLSLTKFWDEHRLQAYEGVSVPGFPNLFSVMGPYGYVGSSYFALIEAQTHHIVRCLRRAHRHGATRVEVTEKANARYFADVMRRRRRQVFWQDSCRLANSYYFDKNGDVALRPATTFEVYWRSRRFDLDDYRFTG
jgi:cation diffusion facilitator CzcD-associated flavoprotein CzcO